MEQIRHLIVHKNGLADKTFIEKTSFKHINIGEKIIVREQFIANAGLATSWVATVIYQAILEKYFEEFQKILKRLLYQVYLIHHKLTCFYYLQYYTEKFQF